MWPWAAAKRGARFYRASARWKRAPLDAPRKERIDGYPKQVSVFAFLQSWKTWPFVVHWPKLASTPFAYQIRGASCL